jgi:hypothetical protein
MHMVRRFIGWAGFALLVAGCQSAYEPEAVAPVPAAKSAASSGDSTPPSQPSAPARRDVAEFEPPFPGRTELFVPPRGGQGTVRRDEEYGETIELKGFVDVNGPQVVLAIDGVISPIPEGGEKYGVQVISINPPQVVLQRGRNRWTASLE